MKRTPFVHISILVAFLFNSILSVPLVQAQQIILPKPGVRVHLSPPLNPPMLKGIKVNPNNPFRFDFILDKGDAEETEGSSFIKDESTKLIKYFLASLTIPEKDLWVNLSPYEKDRIVPESFGLTEMGRDLLAQDYMLKQVTASLIYPEDEVGKKFWKRVYEEAARKYGTTNIPVNTFNKVWIVPEKAVVYENAKAGTAYVVESKLKVMLEQDYLSLQKNTRVGVAEGGASSAARNAVRTDGDTRGQDPNLATLGSQIVREIVIPELTKEVNEGKNFAQLRQVYNSLILATWYKKKIKESILSKVYTDRNKVQGVNIEDPQEKQKIYQQYLQAFKKGVYNYIKEDLDPATQQRIPRKYFSGGFGFNGIKVKVEEDDAMLSSVFARGVRNLLLLAASVITLSSNPVQAARIIDEDNPPPNSTLYKGPDQVLFEQGETPEQVTKVILEHYGRTYDVNFTRKLTGIVEYYMKRAKGNIIGIDALKEIGAYMYEGRVINNSNIRFGEMQIEVAGEMAEVVLVDPKHNDQEGDRLRESGGRTEKNFIILSLGEKDFDAFSRNVMPGEGGVSIPQKVFSETPVELLIRYLNLVITHESAHVYHVNTMPEDWLGKSKIDREYIGMLTEFYHDPLLFLWVRRDEMTATNVQEPHVQAMQRIMKEVFGESRVLDDVNDETQYRKWVDGVDFEKTKSLISSLLSRMGFDIKKMPKRELSEEINSNIRDEFDYFMVEKALNVSTYRIIHRQLIGKSDLKSIKRAREVIDSFEREIGKVKAGKYSLKVNKRIEQAEKWLNEMKEAQKNKEEKKDGAMLSGFKLPFVRALSLPLIGAVSFLASQFSLIAQSPEVIQDFKNQLESIGRMTVTTEQATKMMTNGYADMLKKLKAKHKGAVVPDDLPYVKKIVGDAITFNQIASRVSAEFSKMTPTQKDEVLIWVSQFVDTIPYDEEGVKDPVKKKFIGDLYNAIVGNPLENMKKTAVCESYSILVAMILNALGFENHFWQVEVTENFVKEQMRPKGGHTAVVVDIGEGQVSWMDIAQGRSIRDANGNIKRDYRYNIKIPHVEFSITQYDPVRKGWFEYQVKATPKNLNKYKGDTYPEIKERLRILAEKHRLFAAQPTITALLNDNQKSAAGIELTKKVIGEINEALKSEGLNKLPGVRNELIGLVNVLLKNAQGRVVADLLNVPINNLHNLTMNLNGIIQNKKLSTTQALKQLENLQKRTLKEWAAFKSSVAFNVTADQSPFKDQKTNKPVSGAEIDAQFAEVQKVIDRNIAEFEKIGDSDLSVADLNKFANVHNNEINPLFEQFSNAKRAYEKIADNKEYKNAPLLKTRMSEIERKLENIKKVNPDLPSKEVESIDDLLKQVNDVLNPDGKSKDKAMLLEKGGIDFNADKFNLQIQNAGEGIKFDIDPAMLKQLQNATGFTPLIMNIQPVTDLKLFLGLNISEPLPSKVSTV